MGAMDVRSVTPDDEGGERWRYDTRKNPRKVSLEVVVRIDPAC